MEVELREITAKNFDECVMLDVAEHQRGFVATNVMSIAQSKVYPTLESKAVYADGEMVGFVMYGFDPETGRFSLARLMIDARRQGEGLGRASTKKVLETLRDREGCDSVYLSFVPENTGAEALYKSIGFEKTGEIDDESGEIVMRYAFR
jgi:diamine N-acetyltransferase